MRCYLPSKDPPSKSLRFDHKISSGLWWKMESDLSSLVAPYREFQLRKTCLGADFPCFIKRADLWSIPARDIIISSWPHKLEIYSRVKRVSSFKVWGYFQSLHFLETMEISIVHHLIASSSIASLGENIFPDNLYDHLHVVNGRKIWPSRRPDQVTHTVLGE